MTNFEPVPAEDLVGKSRAELLEICKTKGLKATAWKRDKMHAVLTGAEAVVEKKTAALAKVPPRPASPDEDEPLGAGKKKDRNAQERMKARTGPCAAIGCTCQGWVPSGNWDPNRFWEMCHGEPEKCGHTQWNHTEPGQAREDVVGYLEPQAKAEVPSVARDDEKAPVPAVPAEAEDDES